jgi:hypothetical protein
MHTSIHSGRTEITRHPRTQWFYGLCRALPGDRAFLSPSPVRNVFLTNLTPASRRQDHTILPSASKALSSEAPPAATASSPASVTIAIRPLSGVDGGGYKLICDFGKSEYFFEWDWTGQITLIRLRKLDFRRKSAGGAREAGSPDQANGLARAEAIGPHPLNETR